MKRSILGIVLFAGGCASVPAYERETLASSRMSIDGDADEAYLVTTRRRAREEGTIATGAGVAGGAAAGGGCGCN